MSSIMLNIKSFVNNLASRETSWLEKAQVISLLGIILTTFVPIKYVLTGIDANPLDYYSDFTAITIYGSMIFMVFFLICGLFKAIFYDKQKDKVFIKILSSLVLIFLVYGLFMPESQNILGSYTWLRISCVILLGYLVYISDYWLKYKEFLLSTIVFMGAINAIIAILQFCLQSSLGLNILGESPLTIDAWGVAKSVAYETTFVRGYGLFPHPNVLAGILVIVSLLNLYLLNKTIQSRSKILLYISFFLISAGIFASLSRAGILAFGFGLITWWGINLLSRNYKVVKQIFISVLWLLILTYTFLPWLSARATWNDSAVIERGIFNNAAIETIRDNWLIGTGPGSNLIVLHEKLISEYDYWLIQPVHNYFLITISELGLIGVLILIIILYFLGLILIKTLSRLKQKDINIEWGIALTSIAVTLFILFWFDHYFYTIWPAQILLWFMIGLIARETKNPAS